MRKKLPLILACLLPACGLPDSLQRGKGDPIHIVLTFDDGPFAADMPLQTDDPDKLLAPLSKILDTLHRRDIQTVFYTSVFASGQATDQAAVTLMPAFARGVLAEHDAGHIVGFHCYDHSPAVWIDSNLDPFVAISQMSEDVQRLREYASGALRQAGSDAETIFTPIFRQPFGALDGVFAAEGLAATAPTGWIYHGFWIDSGDWTDNTLADPAIVSGLPVSTEQDHVAFVLRRFREGAEINRDRSVVDVLLHVNQFTADHLDLWIDDLANAFAAEGRDQIVFDVPSRYLTTSDLYVDAGISLSFE